jgi:hypothetical protein
MGVKKIAAIHIPKKGLTVKVLARFSPILVRIK